MSGISRDYWLDYAKTNVSNSIESRETAAKRLDDFLFWVWGIYTGAFAAGSVLQYFSNSIAQMIVAVQPVFVIMFARFFCTYVSMPSSITADPNVISEIIEAHLLIVNIKRIRLRNAIIATVISMLSLCVALGGYNVLDSTRKLKQEISNLKLTKEKKTLEKEITDISKNTGKP